MYPLVLKCLNIFILFYILQISFSAVTLQSNECHFIEAESQLLFDKVDSMIDKPQETFAGTRVFVLLKF